MTSGEGGGGSPSQERFHEQPPFLWEQWEKALHVT